jgi:hypothetical protein
MWMRSSGRPLQERAEFPEQLLAFAPQSQAATHTIEQLDPELLLKVADLPGQCWLCDVQMLRRLGHRAQLGDSDEGFRVLQIHALSLCRIAIKHQCQPVLDARRLSLP